MYLGMYCDSDIYTVTDVMGEEISDGERCWYSEAEGEYIAEGNVYAYLREQIKKADGYISEIKDALEKYDIDEIDTDEVLEVLGFQKIDLEEPDMWDEYDPIEYEDRRGRW